MAETTYAEGLACAYLLCVGTARLALRIEERAAIVENSKPSFMNSSCLSPGILTQEPPSRLRRFKLLLESRYTVTHNSQLSIMIIK